MDDSTNLDAYEPGSGQPESSPAVQPGPFPTLLPAPPEASIVRKIFVGIDGLRAGWSLLIFALILGLLLVGLRLAVQGMHLQVYMDESAGDASPSVALFGEGVPFLLILVATWIMSKIEKRPNSVYGLGGQRALPHFFEGLAWGVGCLSLLVFTLWKTGYLVVDSRLLFGAVAVRYGAIWLLGFLMVGFLEEYLTRGYVFFTLTRGLAGIYSWLFKTHRSKAFGFWTAALLLSILFGLGHKESPGESPIGLLSAGLSGLVFSLSLWRTGSLWWAIGFHSSWDWAQSFLYGVPDSGLMVQHHFLATHAHGATLMSGGATGPEGSIFVLPVLVLVSCIAVFTLPRPEFGQTVRPPD